ncbi:MAG: hypothetical protein EKK55_18440 [Rhodocyclaceae bacterium]|nr:MAG: hypothetical protein EKK55_18440 [Rhodocyclaceae bacterium]
MRSVKTYRKSLPFELKAASTTGEFRAVFATFNVIDHDGDVTVPGAFKDGTEVIIGSFGHKTADLPVGKGVIVANDREASVEGKFFLDTGPGKDTYQTVKNLGGLGEWSYVFSVLKQSFGEKDGRPVRYLEDMKVYSVDPVLAGAGIDTRTTDIKSLSFVEHGEEVKDALQEYLSRVKERTAVRGTEGRSLSVANVASLGELAESLKNLQGELGQLLQPEPKSNELVAREFVRFQHILAGLPA